MKKYFITGTDTNVGKTLVSSILMLGLDAHYWKPIQSGVSDVQQVQEWTGLDDSRFLSTCYTFGAALSPDQAAHLENKTIDLEQCKLPPVSGNLIVESAGGVLAPLNDSECISHLIQKLQLPVIIVARGTLGTINHTLLTIESLRNRNIEVYGVIFSGELNPDNKKAIEKKGQVKTLLQVPLFENLSRHIIKEWTFQNRAQILENFI